MHDDEDNLENFGSKALSVEKVKEWTGWEDLDLVLSATFRVDADALIGLDRLPEMLPKVNSLRLTGSRLPKIRLLGSKMNSLKFLWLNHSKVESLQGIGAFAPNLTELFVAFNRIKDITPIMDISDTLEVLDLEGNEIEGVERTSEALSSLKRLTSLTLQGNPITRDVDTKRYLPDSAEDIQQKAQKGRLGRRQSLEMAFIYRKWIKIILPSIQTLDDFPIDDDVPVDDDDSRPTTRVSSANSGHNVYFDPMDAALAEELRLVQESLRETGYDPLDQGVEDANKAVYTRPSTSCQGARPVAKKATSKSGVSSDSRGRGPRAAESSGLTTGNAFAGSAIASLRKRGGVTPPQPSIPSAQPLGKDVEDGNSPKQSSPLLTGDVNADLFITDEAEDEYDRLKAELIRQRFVEKDLTSGRPTSASASKLLERLSAEEAAASLDPSSSAAREDMKKEVDRVKAQIARGGATSGISEETSNFVQHGNFEVVDEKDMTVSDKVL
ncbi:Leucine rich repeat, putative [Angomonas deanei]|uniref:Leucine rich repeat, putative n=1 Tax=Angomonas deanei TaxID=59799 RepID=A0A7G2CCE0_9TRYP|nr:Leucine rich repeat, putative [Angomonas deanei]